MEPLRFALLGLGAGGLYVLIAQAIVVVHRGSGVLNFATAAIGMVAAFVYSRLTQRTGLPVMPAVVLSVALAALIGVVFYVAVMKFLDRASVLVRTVATLGLMTLLTGLAGVIFAPNGQVVSVPSFLSESPVSFGSSIKVPADTLLIAGISVAVTLLLSVFHKRTRLGLATSAVAENRIVAAGAGWSPNLVAGTSWAIGSGVAGFALILAAPVAGLNPTTLSLLVVPALAAALVGRFESALLTLAGGMLIGIVQSEAGRYLNNPGWYSAAPLLVILLALIIRGSSLPTKSQISVRLPSVTPGSLGPWSLVWLAVGTVMVALLNEQWLSPLVSTLLAAFAVLSVVVVAGFAGQLSLAQGALAGMSAFLVAFANVTLGLPMLWSMVVAVSATIPIGVVVAVPALRVRGTHLAIATLALASVVDALVINNPGLTTPIQGPPFSQLSVFGLEFDGLFHTRSFAFLVLGVLAVVMVIVSNVRSGPVGRRLLAVRANERAAASLGVSVASTKLYAFALGAAIAGIGGALYESQLAFADFSPYTVIGSINVVLEGTIGGIGWIGGAPLGAVSATGGIGSKVISSFVAPGNWLLVIAGGGVILVLLQSPDGLFPFNRNLLRGAWERIKRAARRAGKDPQASLAVGDPPQPRAPVALEFRDVRVTFGATTALDGVSFLVNPGEVVGLIGANGAGKSTVIEVISGFQSSESGDVLIDGESITRLSPAKRARMGINRSFQTLELFEDLSALDNLRVASEPNLRRQYLSNLAWRSSEPVDALCGDLIDRFDLEPVLEQKPTEIDHARRHLLGIARTFAANPAIVLLDEPASGLDQRERRELVTHLQETAKEVGKGVLVVDHDVDLIFALCDRVIVLDAGRIIAEGAPGEVRSHPDVVAAYLGAAAEAPPHEAGSVA